MLLQRLSVYSHYTSLVARRGRIGVSHSETRMRGWHLEEGEGNTVPEPFVSSGTALLRSSTGIYEARSCSLSSCIKHGAVSVSLTLSVSGHGHAAIPNIAVQQPFSLLAFPHHDILPVIEHRAPFTRQGVLAHLIGGISLSIHVKGG